MKFRIYYQVEYTLLSPLALGSGINENSDNDLAKGGDGLPFIPATSIAGVYRSLLTPEDQKKYFGCKDSTESSRIIFYDGTIQEKKTTSIRDCVALDEYKTAIDGSKFDFEIVETGAKFIAFIETRDEDTEKIIDDFLNYRDITFGAKTTRGYGTVSIRYRKKKFAISSELEKWLEFNLFDEKAFEDCEYIKPSEDLKGFMTITLNLNQKGAISIRQYSTEDKFDYEQMHLESGNPVIPGTSWAGAFRHGFDTLKGERNSSDRLFGCIDNDNSEKSKIRFSESIITDYEEKIVTRNSIDRFSGGTKDGALYTEKTIYNGKTTLQIKFKDTANLKDKLVLGACITDLHNGFLAVGGLTSVGRGMFTVDKIFINGTETRIDNIMEEMAK